MDTRLRQRHHAMATWFELRVAEGDPAYVRQAGIEAFHRLDAIESTLSRFREESEISAINRLRPGESLVLGLDTWNCLQIALEAAELTGGAFDPGLGAAMDRQRGAADAAVPEKRGRLLLEPSTRSVRCEGGPVSIDLGAIGKGFALDEVSELLTDWNLGPYLLVGGNSSILAAGGSGKGWDINLTEQTGLRLIQGSIGCSGVAVKGAHILDPRTGQPAQTPARAWALTARAAFSDALSTAFMVLPQEDLMALCEARPDVGAVIQPNAASPEILRFGKALSVAHQYVKGERLKD